MEMKSVPPPLAPTVRQIEIAVPLIIPPKMLISSTSTVISKDGRISVSILPKTITYIEYKVKFRPRYFNPI